MGFLASLFSKLLTRKEIGEHLTRASKYELSGIVSCAAPAMREFLSDNGLKQAAQGQKILKKHPGIFRGCSSGADIGAAAMRIIARWPDVTPGELAFLSDLVKGAQDAALLLVTKLYFVNDDYRTRSNECESAGRPFA